MTPKEILNLFYDELNQRAKVVNSANRTTKDGPITGFSLLTVGENTQETPYVDRYKHITIVTRKYRDEGCATYKLIRGMESIFPEKVEKLFWRYNPEVVNDSDFNNYYRVFKGRVRFSFL